MGSDGRIVHLSRRRPRRRAGAAPAKRTDRLARDEARDGGALKPAFANSECSARCSTSTTATASTARRAAKPPVPAAGWKTSGRPAPTTCGRWTRAVSIAISLATRGSPSRPSPPSPTPSGAQCPCPLPAAARAAEPRLSPATPIVWAPGPPILSRAASSLGVGPWAPAEDGTICQCVSKATAAGGAVSPTASRRGETRSPTRRWRGRRS